MVDIPAAVRRNLVERFAAVGLTERFRESVALMMLSYGWCVDRYRPYRFNERPTCRLFIRVHVCCNPETQQLGFGTLKFRARGFSGGGGHTVMLSGVRRNGSKSNPCFRHQCPKSGTTWISRYLAKHSEIGFAWDKEVDVHGRFGSAFV